MKFMITWTPPTGPAGQEMRRRFVETQGVPVPGVTLIGRWFSLAGQGVAIVECNDVVALRQERMRWSDLMPIQIAPCVDNAEMLKPIKDEVKAAS